jgi:glycosyltransferase involved in cell wall biosynthesis
VNPARIHRRTPQKRLAIFLIGGIGGGIALQGVPAITAITESLANTFEVSVYSLMRPDHEFTPKGYTLYSPPRWLAKRAVRKLRWSWLACQFLAEHWKRPYDVLLSFWGYPMGLFVVLLGHLVRRPSVITILGAEAASVPSIGYGHMRLPTTRRLVIATCARATEVVVLSSHQRAALRRYGLRRNDLRVVPFGIDQRLFPWKPASRQPPLKILHVANLTEVKDQQTLVRGFALVRKQTVAKLRIVGPDHLNGKLQSLVQDLDVQDDVEFVGPVPYTAIPSHYEWADMFVLTSLSEGQCTSLAEAAMSGVLQVSTPVGCIIDQGEEATVVVRPGDPIDLAEKIVTIASDRAAWDSKVARARVWAESHDLQWTIAQFTDVINQAVSWN